MSNYSKPLVLVAFFVLIGIASILSSTGCSDNNSIGQMTDLFNFEPSPDDTNELKALLVEVVKEPQPFEANDGLVHLVYEVKTTNFTDETVELSKLTVWGDSTANPPLLELEGADFMQRTLTLEYHPFKRAALEDVTVDQIAPGQTVVSFLDVTVDSFDQVPDKLINRVQVAGSGVIALVLGPTGALAEVDTYVNHKPVLVLGNPIKGGKWINLNGCCDFVNSAHRRVIRSVDGVEFYPERYSIDIMEVDDENNLFVGDSNLNESWLGYGAELIASADGVVARVVKGLPDNKPGESPPFPISLADGAGNNVILHIGEGIYILYAHLIPGSNDHLEVGDFVAKREMVGLLGNTGQSGAPHLHYQVMDGNSIAQAEGVPFVFEDFSNIGELIDVVEEDGDNEGDGLDIDDVIDPVAEEEEPQNDPGIILTDVELLPSPEARALEHQLQFTIIEFPE